MRTGSSPRPAIIVLGDHEARDHEARRSRVSRALGRWFARDYRILDLAVVPNDPTVVTQLREADTDVALVITDETMKGEAAIALLARIREVLPTSRRVLLVGWEGGWETQVIARASILGDIDAVVGWPWSINDEQFLATIGDLLADWATEHGRYVESSTLLAEPDDATAHELRDEVIRWSVPLGYYDTESELGRRLARRLPADARLPAIILPDGRVLSRPAIADIANALGANSSLSDPFDVAIVGSGPAGLAAAVNGVADGLRTLVIEPSALGGQASSSPLIRNYLGFPCGISGADLMARALRQAWAFGAGLQVGRSATALRADGDGYVVELSDGSVSRARSVVLAMGVSYRTIGIPSVERLCGRGVFYGAGATEGPAVAGGDAFVVGGGNSAGQAAVSLARYARSVTLVVRGSSLDDMSDYLVEQVRHRGNIEVRLNTVIAEARGDGRLGSLVLRDTARATTEERDALALFILIGATPRTGWLPPEVARDPRGYILTGRDVHDGDRARDDASAEAPTLATSLPGVFAAGDVRHGSVKRVAAAVGEGAAAIREIHAQLAASHALVQAGASG